MQWPSESDAKTTEPGQREAVVWALCVMVNTRWSCGVVKRVRERLTSEAALPGPGCYLKSASASLSAH